MGYHGCTLVKCSFMNNSYEDYYCKTKFIFLIWAIQEIHIQSIIQHFIHFYNLTILCKDTEK